MPTKNQISLYRLMLLINQVEERIAEEYDQNQIYTPVHLAIGQEAISAGICSLLGKKDLIFSTHRSHAQYIAKGASIQAFINELYGKKEGCSGGKGGSMHLIDVNAGVMGSTSIVGGSIPLATGAALKMSVRKEKNVAVCFFGDGAAEEGVFHECLNFASLRKLPVVYVCENNGYAVFTPESKRKHISNLYTWGEKFGIPGYRVDGNDLDEIQQCAESAISKAREGQGPALIEAITCLKYAHVGNKTDIHLGHKNKEVYFQYMQNSPVHLYAKKIGMSETEKEFNLKEIREEVEHYFNTAKQAETISIDSLYKNLY
jgi:acetoin:2,6-dichlorophenolindophenol oxidoreductase subunit alpha